MPAATAPLNRHVAGGAARRAFLTGVAAAVASSIAAVVVATIAKSLGVQHATQLEPSALVFLTVIGVAVGTAAWVLISRHAAEPTRLLRRLVPIVLVLSFIPDLAIGLGDDSWGAALTLALAHVTVFAVTLSLLSRQLAPGTVHTATASQSQTG